MDNFIRKFKLIKVKYKYKFYDDRNIEEMNKEIKDLLDDYKIKASVKFNRKKSNMVLGRLAFDIDIDDNADKKSIEYLEALKEDISK